MRSTIEKSMLWCGEKVKWLGETIENGDENKKPESVLSTEEKLKKAAEDIKFLCDMTQEDLDATLEFDEPDTFATVNTMVNEEPKPFCGELDQLFSQKKFLPIDEQSIFEEKKYGAKFFVSRNNRSRFKRTNFIKYEANLRNGFYTGFMTTFLCYQCENILSCHPSAHKRINWISENNCHYCTKQAEKPNTEDIYWCDTVSKQFKERIRVKDKGDLAVKILRDPGRNFKKAFEHTWCARMDVD